MLRSTIALPADHSARPLHRAPARATEPTAPRRPAWTAVVARIAGRAFRTGPGIDPRQGEATHRLWRSAAVGGGPGMR